MNDTRTGTDIIERKGPPAVIYWTERDEDGRTWLTCRYYVNGSELLFFDGWKTDAADPANWTPTGEEEGK